MKVPQPRLNIIELTLFGGLVAVLAYQVGAFRTTKALLPFLSHGEAELRVLAERYGPARNSEHGEEWILRDFFQDQRGGVFVDVGANHYRRDNNTYHLETQLGWSGLAVEPQVKFAADYAAHRPRTRFVPLFVSAESNRQAVLYVPSNDLVASSDKAFAESVSNGAAEPVSVRTTTLDDVLDRSGIRQIDFLSIDIELHEPEALRGFSIARFKPRLVCVEAHAPVRQQILDYFATHGYVVVGKYLRADSDNIWFTQLEQSRAPSPAGRSR